MDAQGRFTEVLGFNLFERGCVHFISYEYRWDGDFLQRILRTKNTVFGNRDKIDPETYKILATSACGVNVCIGENRSSIPSCIEPITAEDIEAEERGNYFRFYNINEALVKLTDLPREFPDLSSDQPRIRTWIEPVTAEDIKPAERSNNSRG